MRAGIYTITHVASGRVYVGSSRDVRCRVQKHLWMLRRGAHDSPHLQRAYNRDGEGAFVALVVEDCQEIMLIEREQLWIDQMRATETECGYNVLPFATRKCMPHSAETKATMSAARKGTPKSEEHRRKIGEANRGKVRSQETRARIAQTLSTIYADPDLRIRQTEYGRLSGGHNKGVRASDAARAAMSVSAKRRCARSFS